MNLSLAGSSSWIICVGLLAGLGTATCSAKYSVAAVSIPLIVSRGWAIGGGSLSGLPI